MSFDSRLEALESQITAPDQTVVLCAHYAESADACIRRLCGVDRDCYGTIVIVSYVSPGDIDLTGNPKAIGVA